MVFFLRDTMVPDIDQDYTLVLLPPSKQLIRKRTSSMVSMFSGALAGLSLNPEPKTLNLMEVYV